MRNHNTLTRDKLIPELAKCVPEGHTVSLDNPELFILVEIFKVRQRARVLLHTDRLTTDTQSVCGISVVKNYYKFQKFNIMEIANARNLREEGEESRVVEKPKEAGSAASKPVTEGDAS